MFVYLIKLYLTLSIIKKIGIKLMSRSYYNSSITNFVTEDENSILGQLSLNHSNRHLEDLQKNAWVKQIEILKDQLEG